MCMSERVWGLMKFKHANEASVNLRDCPLGRYCCRAGCRAGCRAVSEDENDIGNNWSNQAYQENNSLISLQSCSYYLSNCIIT